MQEAADFVHRTGVPAVVGIVAYACSLGLLAHHGWVHSLEPDATSHAKRESCWWVGYFQLKDVAHCETWAAICLVNGLLMLSLGPGQLWDIAGAILLGMAVALMAVGAVAGMLSLEHVHNHETWILVGLTAGTTLMLV